MDSTSQPPSAAPTPILSAAEPARPSAGSSRERAISADDQDGADRRRPERTDRSKERGRPSGEGRTSSGSRKERDGRSSGRPSGERGESRGQRGEGREGSSRHRHHGERGQSGGHRRTPSGGKDHRSGSQKGSASKSASKSGSAGKSGSARKKKKKKDVVVPTGFKFRAGKQMVECATNKPHAANVYWNNYVKTSRYTW
jgi:hypothetical protein